MAKRLSIALALSILIGFGCYVILPHFGVTLPPWVPVLAFAFMALASVAVELERDKKEDEDEESGACCGDPGHHDQFADNCNERCTGTTLADNDAPPIDHARSRAH